MSLNAIGWPLFPIVNVLPGHKSTVPGGATARTQPILATAQTLSRILSTKESYPDLPQRRS